ncbi:MAG: hypothetical protein HY290_20550 [Planctomycetia bacterium]|nr:hypothetical protein [Planctomycetia bacterium]
MAPLQSTSSHFEHTIREHSAPVLPVHLVLEVTRGSTRFRRRPVNSARFLIGAGKTCDLRIGGDGMPALHSIITTAGRDITLEAIATEPVLAVNGNTIQSALLHDGDIINFGQVELLARLEAGHAPAGVEVPEAGSTETIDAERPIADLSAAELVDLIEHDEHEIEEFETRQHVGLKALVQEAMSRANRPSRRAPIPAPHFLAKRPQGVVTRARQAQGAADRMIHDDLEKLGEQLSNLSQELKGTTERASRRDAEIASATDDLLDTQHKLVSQLETVLDQVQTLKASDAPVQKPRAIA